MREIILGGLSISNPFGRYFDVLIALTQKELRVRYKSYLLGYVWSLAQPLAFACVFYFAFKVAMKVQTKDYVLFLLSGLFPWQWISNSINVSPMMFLMNASIIKKVNFPRSAVVVALVLQDAIHFIFSLPILIVFGLIYGRTPSLTWIVGLPFLLLLQVGCLTGYALFIASLNIFFRDLERLTSLLMTILILPLPRSRLASFGLIVTCMGSLFSNGRINFIS
jgi:lipopolysaccharide transport system permease protein